MSSTLTELLRPPAGSRPENVLRNNGPDQSALERYKLRELAEGWPCYRDACEWENFASIFDSTAIVYTTWSGPVHFQDFIEASKRGVQNGAFIMHRCHGLTTDINLSNTRAVTKMKAIITQRFNLGGCEVDAESDCRFCFFWEKSPSTGEWKAKLVRHWYEKDKLILVDPRKMPTIDDDLLQSFPEGYRYLGYCQEKTMGVTVARDMPGHWKHKVMDGASQKAGENHDMLYWSVKEWLTS